MYCMFFFFQAEDGIRDSSVTGVQTCALPICRWLLSEPRERTLLHSQNDYLRSHVTRPCPGSSVVHLLPPTWTPERFPEHFCAVAIDVQRKDDSASDLNYIDLKI